MDLGLIALIIGIVALIIGIVSIVISAHLNRQSKKLTLELNRFSIKEISGKDVTPIFNEKEEIAGKNIFVVVNEKLKVGENAQGEKKEN